MLTEFNVIIKDICDYYCKPSGIYTRETLAEEIGISKRALQKWESSPSTPQVATINELYRFLREHGGNNYIIRLKQALGAKYVEPSKVERGQFPKELPQEDIDAIRLHFPRCDELNFICAMITYENQVRAANEVLPNANLPQIASLISRWNVRMDTCKRIFGFANAWDWQYNIIMYIDDVPKIDGDVEALGQIALDNIIAGYLERKCKVHDN